MTAVLIVVGVLTFAALAGWATHTVLHAPVGEPEVSVLDELDGVTR